MSDDRLLEFALDEIAAVGVDPGRYERGGAPGGSLDRCALRAP
jgi:hypothetical protein